MKDTQIKNNKLIVITRRDLPLPYQAIQSAQKTFFYIFIYMGKKLTTKSFIEKAIKIHNNFYDYSSVIYVNSKTKVNIKCPYHGNFKQIPENHLLGRGCNKCALELKSLKQRDSLDSIINKAQIIHGHFYDYSKVIYKNTYTKIKIICPKHGEFNLTPAHHLQGIGCSKCSGNFLDKNLFIEKSKKVHGDFFDYLNVDYINNKTKINIKCPHHGYFKQTPSHHLQGSGCPICRESKGEREIRLWLLSENIYYIPQKRFNECKDKQPLPFDFYLPKHNLCIEYDGRQHFKPVKQFGGTKGFEDRVKKDKIKSKFCEDNGINLLRIKYNENIKNNLKNNLK